MDQNKLWKILQEMRIPDYFTCLLWNLYAHQEATVRMGHGITDWFQIGKGICQHCMLLPYLFNLHAEWMSEVTQSCPTLCYSMDSGYHAPPSMGFSRKEDWSGLPFSSPGNLPDPGIESRSPTFQADTLPSEPPGNTRVHHAKCQAGRSTSSN